METFITVFAIVALCWLVYDHFRDDSKGSDEPRKPVEREPYDERRDRR